jgi:hypothetical protein
MTVLQGARPGAHGKGRGVAVTPLRCLRGRQGDTALPE